MDKYDHQSIEKKWQERWVSSGAFNTPDKKDGAENFYFLTEFPYPSGNLHVGHWYAFSVPDIFVRYMRARGYNVMYPIGFDAFGLPAENAAIKNKLNPREWTFNNIEYMRGQLRSMGASFDWSREVITANPSYYKWTQWLFLQFYKKGLVYRKETAVNWCPKDLTVLANEQVVDGKCERCGSLVEQRMMPQWNIKITDYADRLIDDLKDLDWPKQIKEAQTNWIGRSEGAEIDFKLTTDVPRLNLGTLTVFTTRPDTLFGVTYMVVAPEHALAQQSDDADVKEYIEQAKQKTELERTGSKEKTGVELKGVKAINPANNSEVPIWVADYVLGNYGTGAIMAVPAHDERDREFAEKHNLPIKQIELEDSKKIVEQVGGKWTKNYHLRDWVVSRQRFWGVPIPMIHCEKCATEGENKGWNPVKETELPVVLPDLEDYLPTGEGKSPLAKKHDWVEVACPKCGGQAERETDTLDTFVDSSWYFERYTDPKNDNEFASKDKLKTWLPVNLYSGGSEHTTMHLLYSRFWHKAMFDLGLVGESEPYLKRMNRGLIMGPDGQKMSKSKGNVIDPDAVVAELGADTVRMYLAFIGPYNEVGAYPWNPNGTVGVRRFLDRVWKLEPSNSKLSPQVEILLNQTIKKVGEDIASLKLNTAVSALMILLNEIEKDVSHDAYKKFVQLLAPFAPHMAHELAERHGWKREEWETWPSFDESKLQNEMVMVAVQINGKVRATIQLKIDASEEEALVLGRQAVAKWLKGPFDSAQGKEKKAVYVPGRVINLVV
ncbi:leucine--tRNA ligase [Candidatus Parcubacteria bacterium]|nr:leucine--tRNA ligase [Candidatus Parcubacteria bacterium]